MKVAILAGGLGTRLSEETVSKPKPMVEIGGRPILWHIMKIFSLYGFNEFVVALGYTGEVIKDYFINYRNLVHSLTIDLSGGNVEVNDGECEEWTLHLLDTGLKTQTGGRIKRVAASGGCSVVHGYCQVRGAASTVVLKRAVLGIRNLWPLHKGVPS
jgi:glucose-1-phosphate cytidylyltransferase